MATYARLRELELGAPLETGALSGAGRNRSTDERGTRGRGRSSVSTCPRRSDSAPGNGTPGEGVRINNESRTEPTTAMTAAPDGPIVAILRFIARLPVGESPFSTLEKLYRQRAETA